MKTICYHVTTSRNNVYGVAATTKRDALKMAQDRITSDGSDDSPRKAERIGTWTAEYGTVLAY